MSFRFKKYYFQIIVAFFVLLLNISWVSTKEGDNDLKQIAIKYKSIDNLIMHQKINYYENYTTKKSSETTITILKKHEDKLYIKAFNQETIIVGDVSLWVDHEAKIMVLNIVDGSEVKKNFDMDIEGLKKISYKMEHLQKKDLGCYIFSFKEGEHLKSDVWYKIDNFSIKKLVYYMRGTDSFDNGDSKKSNPRVEILITRYDTEYEFNELTFDFEKFIISSKEKIELNTNYKNYQLINNIR